MNILLRNKSSSLVKQLGFTSIYHPFKKNFLPLRKIDFGEEGRQEDKNREALMWDTWTGCFLYAPWPEIKPMTSGARDVAPVNWATPIRDIFFFFAHRFVVALHGFIDWFMYVPWPRNEPVTLAVNNISL